MSYLASRGQTGSNALKTTSLGQITRTSSYYTDKCNIISTGTETGTMYSTTRTSPLGVYAALKSADGTPITISRNVSFGSVSQYPDGASDYAVNVTSGFQVARSYTTQDAIQTTTSVAKYSGSEYCNPIYGSRKLVMRTGTGKDDVVKYGLTTNTNAKEYCGLRMRIDGNVAYIGRIEEQTLEFTQSKNQVSTRTTRTVTMTSTVSSLTSSSAYTSSGYTDYYSYSSLSTAGWAYFDANHCSTSVVHWLTASGTSSWLEFRPTALANGVTTSKSTGTTWSSSSTFSSNYVSNMYADSTFTSYSSCHTNKSSTKEIMSGNRSSRMNTSYYNKEGGHIIGDNLLYGSGYVYSIYETYSKNGRSGTVYMTQGNSSYSTTSRITTSFKTYNSSSTMTYVSSYPYASIKISSNSGSYTATSFKGFVSSYRRYTSSQTLLNGSINNTFMSNGCHGSVVGSVTTRSFVTNAYQVTAQSTTNQSKTSTIGYTAPFTSFNNRAITVSAPTCNKTTHYSNNIAMVSADEPVFTIRQSGCYVSRFSEDFREVSVYAADQTFTISTVEAVSVPNAGKTSGAFSTVRYDRAHTYLTTNTTSVTSARLSVGGTYSYSSINGLKYTASIPNGYITRLYSGSTITDKMATYTTSSTWSYFSYTTIKRIDPYGTYGTRTAFANGGVQAYADQFESIDKGYGQVTTSTKYASATYTRTSNASMTFTDYLSGSRLLSHITTGTRTSTYSTSMHTTASNTGLVAFAYNTTTSWLQRTSSSYTTSLASSRVSGSSRYSTTSTYRTNTTTYPATISKTTNEFVHSYSGTTNTTLTSIASMTSTFSSTNGYTMTASIRTRSNTTSRKTAYSTYYTNQVSFTTSVPSQTNLWFNTYAGTASSSSVRHSTCSISGHDPHAFTFTRYAGSYTYECSGRGAIKHINSTGLRVRASLDKDCQQYTTSTSCYTTYTHILDGVNKTGKYIFPSDIVGGVSITSHNYSTYTVSNVESIKSTSSSNAATYSSMYANNITVSTCQSYSCSVSYANYYTTSRRSCGTAKVAEYSNGSYITSRFTLENLYSSTFSSQRRTSTWKKELLSRSTHFSVRGYWGGWVSSNCTTKASTSLATTTYYYTGNYGTYYTSSESYSNRNYSSNNFTISTSASLSSRTSRTTLASYLVGAYTHSRVIASSYVSSRYSYRSTSHWSTWSGYEYSSSTTTAILSNKPYILTSQSSASYGKDFGMLMTSDISYMSLPPAEPNGYICTYSYHTNSYYSSMSTFDTRSTPIHGFVYDKSSTTMRSNSSATTYEAHYTGSEVYLLPKNTSQKASMSYTSTTEFTSFTQLVGNIAASPGILMTYSKATMSKSYLHYVTSSMTMSRQCTSHNYNM